MSDFEFEVKKSNDPIHRSKRKPKLTLQITDEGFNLLAEDGYCLINAPFIANDGEFNICVNQKEGKIKTIKHGESYGYEKYYAFKIKERDYNE